MPIPIESAEGSGEPHRMIVYAGDGGDMQISQGLDQVTVTGGAGSYILVEEQVADHVIDVSPTKIVLRNVASLQNQSVDYSNIERLTISGTGDAPTGDRVYWTTGDSIDDITVTGTLREIPIVVSSGGGDDRIHLDGLVGNGSKVGAGDGNDFVRGSSREDTLEGNGGNDILIGGGGRDVLLGGAGSDIFRYESVQDSGGGGGIDTIGDFERGVDKIDLGRIGTLHWIGALPFSKTPGEVRGTMLGIQADLNGDAVADMVIWVNGANGGGWTMTASDFIF